MPNPPILTLDVPDMSCAHCERTIREALAAVAPHAKIGVDLPAHRVTVEGADAAAAIAALAEAGYEATPV